MHEPSENNWQWLSLFPLIYTNWEENEPNNQGGTEDCGEYFVFSNPQRTYWNDVDCSLPQRTNDIICDGCMYSYLYTI